MVIHKCDICNKIFKQKCHLADHKKRKKPCKKENLKEPPITIIEPQIKVYEEQNKLISEPKKNKCMYCNKIFSTNSHYNRHIKNNCKIKKQNETEKENIFKQLLMEIQELKESNKELKIKIEQNDKENKELNNKLKLKLEQNDKENKDLKAQISKLKARNINKTYINNKNINKGQINNIKIVAYGTEDRNKLGADIIKALRGFKTEVEMTKMLHFNDKYPEYHNVYISNMRDQYAMTFDGEKWVLAQKTEVIDGIYNENKDYVEENLETFIASLSEPKKNALKRWLDTNDDDPKIKQIKEEMKMLLYNERNKVIEINDVELLG